jgi:transcriptional regulator of acetoin/glycerol metabolism
MTQAASARHAERILAVLDEPNESSGVASSWRRCLVDHHLDPESGEPPALLSGPEVRYLRGSMGRLLRSADAELDRLYCLVRELGYHVLMTDLSGIVVERRVPEGDETGCRKWCLWTGAVWREEVEGTNGVGTCLFERRPVTVHREQHFRHRHTPLTCTVAPLFDVTGQMTGALDASSIRPDPTGRIIPLVMNAVRETTKRIEKKSFHSFFSRSLILALPEGADDVSVPLLALDADRQIVGATLGARLALGLDDQARIGSIALNDILFAAPPAEVSSLADGERMVITGALAQTQGNVTAAAALLGISRSTLHRKISRLQLGHGRPSDHHGHAT